MTHQPHQLLSYCNCHAILQCQPISYTLPAATLFWVTLLWATLLWVSVLWVTPPSLFVLFISKSWFSNLQNPRVSQLNFVWESKNEQKRATSGKFPGICKTKVRPSWLLGNWNCSKWICEVDVIIPSSSFVVDLTLFQISCQDASL